MSNLTAPIMRGCPFDDLTRELKQMIFKWAATDNTNDIQVELEEDTSTKLRAPAIDLLISLKAVSDYIYYEALCYLTSPSVRWVFTSNTQPHRYLLRAFRDQVPLDIRRRITHVHLSRVTLYGLFLREHIYTRSWTQFNSLPFMQNESRSGYCHRMVPGQKEFGFAEMAKFKTDINASMTLLFLVLPSITQLDIALDGLECTSYLEPRKSHLQDEPIYYRPEYFKPDAFLLELFSRQMKMKNIGKLDLRIFWDDLLEQRFQVDWSKAITVQIQDLFISSLKRWFPNKSITGHRKIPTIN